MLTTLNTWLFSFLVALITFQMLNSEMWLVATNWTAHIWNISIIIECPIGQQ